LIVSNKPSQLAARLDGARSFENSKALVDLIGSSSSQPAIDVSDDAVVVIERVEDFIRDPDVLNSSQDHALQNFVQRHLARGRGSLIATGVSDSTGFQSFNWMMLSLIRMGEGILLSPSADLAVQIFNTTFPNISMTDLPQERGFLVGQRSIDLVQFVTTRGGE